MSESIKKYKNLSLIFLIIFFILQLIWSFYLIPTFKKYSGTSQTIDATFNYNYETIMELLIMYKSSGIKFYNYIQIFDIFYSISYFLFFIFTFRFIFSFLEENLDFYLPKAGFLTISTFLPTLTFLFDLVENTMIYIIRINFPYITKNIINISNIFTLLKFSFFIINFILLILLIIKCFYLFSKKKLINN